MPNKPGFDEDPFKPGQDVPEIYKQPEVVEDAGLTFHGRRPRLRHNAKKGTVANIKKTARRWQRIRTAILVANLLAVVAVFLVLRLDPKVPVNLQGMSYELRALRYANEVLVTIRVSQADPKSTISGKVLSLKSWLEGIDNGRISDTITFKDVLPSDDKHPIYLRYRLVVPQGEATSLHVKALISTPGGNVELGRKVEEE